MLVLFVLDASAVFDYTIKNVTVSKKKMTQESKLMICGFYKRHLMFAVTLVRFIRPGKPCAFSRVVRGG
ncbi:hypothetical protein DWG95_03825 [Escherichia coli]|nr:hypothetical protein C1192_03490 [Escherichia marmotae]EFO1359887.1 hypothetical protein [Escherichia coli]PSS42540.1 hypothetical protein BEM40_001055 [Escherichia sp. MOD1-EC5451]PSY68523.1 hypothetical protein C7B16_00590 [Escherichia sp. 20412-1]EFO1627192.1 hypothetical protein [Escherichia coli]